MESPRSLFAAQLSRPDADIDLIEAALLIAREHDALVDPATSREALEALARRAATRVAGTPGAVAQTLCHFLAREEGFRGNTADYYNPDNSYLNRVLDARTGIPISLALVYLGVAERLGVAAAGVSFPGHFLVRVEASTGEGPTLIDPFAGRPLSVQDCAELLHTNSRGTMAFSAQLLAPAAKREILRRMLGNLKQIYLQREDFAESLSLCDRLLLIDPDAVQERLDRALCLEKLQYFAQAADELERLARRPELAAQPQASAAVARKIQALRAATPGGGRTLH
ncbi:MAG: SirB1 family protein [Pseudomonadota bacterium]|jgi:regulator of sirC expression with transglutaminase-like and TPR domain